MSEEKQSVAKKSFTRRYPQPLYSIPEEELTDELPSIPEEGSKEEKELFARVVSTMQSTGHLAVVEWLHENRKDFSRVGPVLAVSTDEKDKQEGFMRVGPVRTVNEK